METKDYWTLAIAAVGATLGVVNFFIDRWRNRVRLEISVEYGLIDGQIAVPVVRLVNKSPFTLHIERVVVSNEKVMSPAFHVNVIERKRFISVPIAMEPRTASALLLAPVAANPSDLVEIKWVGISTECGYAGFATGPALQVIHEQATPATRFDAFAVLVKSCDDLVIRDIEPPVKRSKGL